MAGSGRHSWSRQLNFSDTGKINASRQGAVRSAPTKTPTRGVGVMTKKHYFQGVLNGAAGGDRTHDPWLRRPILYPLSYSRNAENHLHQSKKIRTSGFLIFAQ